MLPLRSNSRAASPRACAASSRRPASKSTSARSRQGVALLVEVVGPADDVDRFPEEAQGVVEPGRARQHLSLHAPPERLRGHVVGRRHVAADRREPLRIRVETLAVLRLRQARRSGGDVVALPHRIEGLVVPDQLALRGRRIACRHLDRPRHQRRQRGVEPPAELLQGGPAPPVLLSGGRELALHPLQAGEDRQGEGLRLPVSCRPLQDLPAALDGLADGGRAVQGRERKRGRERRLHHVVAREASLLHRPERRPFGLPVPAGGGVHDPQQPPGPRQALARPS